MISVLIFAAGFAAGVVFTVVSALFFLHYASEPPDVDRRDTIRLPEA